MTPHPRRTRPQRSPARRAALAAAFLGATLGGCAESRSAEDARREYARMLLKGGAVGMTLVRAKSIDPTTGDLLDVALDDGTRQLVARRCEILISSENDTISLRLHDVVAADPDTGRLVTIKGLTTEPAKLPYNIVSGAER